jgi:C_GCAxxG_C_C family probable redox protein
MNHNEKAVDLFMQGYNCAQSTAAAFAEDYGYTTESVLKMMAGFGGGIGGLRETCGALSAMVFIAGLHAGDYPPGDLEAKTSLYDLVKEVNREFKDLFGTTCCRELLDKADCMPLPDPSPRTAAYYAERPCARFVGAAAGIIARKIGLE